MCKHFLVYTVVETFHISTSNYLSVIIWLLWLLVILLGMMDISLRSWEGILWTVGLGSWVNCSGGYGCSWIDSSKSGPRGRLGRALQYTSFASPNCGVITFLVAFQTHNLCGFHRKHFVGQFWHHLLILSFLTSFCPALYDLTYK